MLDDGFASFVAKAMNKRVMAPTTQVWITHADENGISKMLLLEELIREELVPDYKRPGRWRVFNPDGSIEEIEP